MIHVLDRTILVFRRSNELTPFYDCNNNKRISSQFAWIWLWILYKCICKLRAILKRFGQIGHWKVFSLCVRMCNSKSRLRTNEVFLQISHSIRVALHTLTWASCSVLCENPSKQPGQWKANSLAWTFACLFSETNCVKHLLQSLHRYGFSPVCIRSCVLTCWLLSLEYSQNRHLCLLATFEFDLSSSLLFIAASSFCLLFWFWFRFTDTVVASSFPMITSFTKTNSLLTTAFWLLLAISCSCEFCPLSGSKIRIILLIDASSFSVCNTTDLVKRVSMTKRNLWKINVFANLKWVQFNNINNRLRLSKWTIWTYQKKRFSSHSPVHWNLNCRCNCNFVAIHWSNYFRCVVFAMIVAFQNWNKLQRC